MAAMIASRLSSTCIGRLTACPCGSVRRGQVLDGLHVDAGVVFHRRVGVFQLVAGEDADDRFVGRMTCSSSSLLQPGDAGGAGGFAAEAVAARPWRGVRGSPRRSLRGRRRSCRPGAQRFGQIDRAADLDGAGDGVGVVVRLRPCRRRVCCIVSRSYQLPSFQVRFRAC